MSNISKGDLSSCSKSTNTAQTKKLFKSLIRSQSTIRHFPLKGEKQSCQLHVFDPEMAVSIVTWSSLVTWYCRRHINKNGGGTASERIWLCKTLNFLIIHHPTLIILAVHEQNMLLRRMAVFIDGDSGLQPIMHSLKRPMEISIGDLTSYNKPGLAAVGRTAPQTTPVRCVIAASLTLWKVFKLYQV